MPKRININNGQLTPNVTVEYTYIVIPKAIDDSKFNEYLVNSEVADYIEKLENEIISNEKTIENLIKNK